MDLIDNKYKKLKLIGNGGISKVYLVMDTRLNKTWALKEINKNFFSSNTDIILNIIYTEVNMLKRLDHPSIPQIVDVIKDDPYIYIVMDYIEGEPLSRIIEIEGSQPEELVVNWAKILCDALQYLHCQHPPIIYRDMKPNNIILTPTGSIKLIDFGIAREYKENSISDTTILGTPGYAPPEQYGGQGQTDQRTDIFSLGATLYYLLTGHVPIESPHEISPIKQWNPNLSLGLESIIEKCIQHNPDNRYQSCKELLYDLDNYKEICFYCYKRNPFSVIISLLKGNIQKEKQKIYINENKAENKIMIDDALYMAKVYANIQNDEKDCSKIEGPNYDE